MRRYTRPYIAGPMRGIKYWNFPAFDAMADHLRKLGLDPVSPADLDREVGIDATKMPEDHDWKTVPVGFDLWGCVDRDINALSKVCDSIVLLPGWFDSVGAKAEWLIAVKLGLPRLDPKTGEVMMETKKASESVVRRFDTGATRSPDHMRDDPEGFLSPIAIDRFCQYMSKHRIQSDGTLRSSDNWQKGMPMTSYMKGAWRHFHHWWTRHRGFAVRDQMSAADMEEDLCALWFNIQGYLHELVKARLEQTPSTPVHSVEENSH